MTFNRIALGLLLSAASASAHAQLAPDALLGGRPKRTVELTAVAAVKHETNIARTSKAAAAAQRVTPEDTYAEPELNVNITQPVGRQVIFLRGAASYLVHDINKDLDALHLDGSAGVGAKVGPCGAVATGSYFQGRNRVQNYDAVSQIDSGLLSTTIRNIQKVRSASADLTCVQSSGFAANFGSRYSYATNSQKAQANGDFETISYNGGLSYQREQFGALMLIASHDTTSYRHRAVAIGPDGYESNAVGLSAQRRLGGRIQAAASVTYTRANTTGPAPIVPPGSTFSPATKFSGLTYSGDLSFRASRFDAKVGFDRSVSPTLIVGGSYDVQTRFKANVAYKLGSRIQLSVGAVQAKSNIRGGISSGPFALTESRTRSVEANARYQLGKRLSIVLSGQHEEQDTDNLLANFTNNVVGLSADFAF